MLAAQRLQLRLRLLPVAYPFGVLGFELFVELLQIAPPLCQLDADLFLERRRALDSPSALTQARQVVGERALALEQRKAPALFRVQSIHLLEPGNDVGQRGDLATNALQLRSRRSDIGELALQTLSIPGEAGRLTLGDAELGEHSVQPFALPLERFPPRGNLVERRPCTIAPLPSLARPKLSRVQTSLGIGAHPRDAVRIGHPRPEAGGLGDDDAAPLPHECLCAAQLLVAEYTGQKLRALRRPHGRHHTQLLLPRKVRVVELVETHAEPPTEQIAHPGEGVGDGSGRAVEEQLRVRQPPVDQVTMAAELEVELHANLRPRASAVEADGIARPACRGCTIQRPRDGLEDRRLARAVRSDDPRETGVEVEARVGVLAKVAEPQRIQPHSVTGSRPRRCRTRSSKRRRCSPPRSDSAGRGRRAPFGRCRSPIRGSSTSPVPRPPEKAGVPETLGR